MTTPTQPTEMDRFLAALRKLVLHALPALKYWIVHEYIVAASDGVTFSGTPTDPDFSPALPVGVPYAPALAGSYSIVPVGSLAYVGFANADPSKPYLVRFGNLATSTSTVIDASAVNVASGTLPAARQTDECGELAADALGVIYYKAATGVGIWTALPVYGSPGPPPGAFSGVTIVITGGSVKVLIG